MAKNQQTNPNTPSPVPPPAKVESAPTWTWVLLGLVVLLIVGKSLISSVFTGTGDSASITTATSSIDTLGCDNGSFIEPRPYGITQYIVMPNECWTNVIYQPNINGRLSRRFAVDPKGQLTVQFGYGGDEWLDPYVTDPGSNRKFPGTTTVRFKNTGSHPVLVNIITS